MSRPVVVTIPHSLGRDEAIRRLRAGFGKVRSSFGESFVILKDEWSGGHLDFHASLLGQRTTGRIDVSDDQVRVEVDLPWVLSLFAGKARDLVREEGRRMLEKPATPEV